MEILISSLIGGAVGLIIGVIFEEPLTSAKKRIIKWIRTLTYRGHRTIHKPETFLFGKTTTSFLVIDGDGEMVYTPETIKCRVESVPVDLPPEIQVLRKSIEKREKNKKEGRGKTRCGMVPYMV